MNLLLSEFAAPAQKSFGQFRTDLAAFGNAGGWYPILESGPGAWQKDVLDVSPQNLFRFGPLFRCVTLIASDVAKLGVRLTELVAGIWQETTSPAFSPVLRKPNRYQTWVQFVECWMLSKLTDGNAYILKVRDERDVVVALYVLHPHLVTTLVAPGAAVFYRLQPDSLSTVEQSMTVPASEIIHDRANTLFHQPLIGIPPIAAAALSGALGVEIQRQSSTFYKNGSRPGGILTSDQEIDDDARKELSEEWHKKFGGANLGRVAVMGNGLEFKNIATTAVDAQLVEHLRLSGEMVCQAFGVPLFKVGLGDSAKKNTNVATLNQIYYSDCLQKHIEDFESCLDVGLSLPAYYGVELNVDNLLRMDQKAQMETLGVGVEKRILAINDARKKLSLRGVPGGDQPWMQMQDLPIEWALELQRLQIEQQRETPKTPAVPEKSNNEAEEMSLGDIKIAWPALLETALAKRAA